MTSIPELLAKHDPELLRQLTARLHSVASNLNQDPSQLVFDFINDCLSAHEDDQKRVELEQSRTPLEEVPAA